jgi:hypothetical protein
METTLKRKIDTINLNIQIQEDLSIIHKKRNYEMIEIYPKVQEVFKILNIPEDRFKMRDKKVSSKVFINHNGIYLEFKSIPPRPNELINHALKNLHIQFKGQWFLENGFEKLLEIFKDLKIKTISKIELSFDFIHEKDFLKQTMNVFLNHRDRIKKLSGKNKIFLNFSYENEESLSYSNASRAIKVYNKSLELKDNRKRDLFYEKNPDFLNKIHYRIEISIIKSSIIANNLKLKELINQKASEDFIINKCIQYFFEDFYIEKSSEIKKILKLIQKSSIYS